MSQIENTPRGQGYNYPKDPTSLTKFLKTMLWISLGISVVLLLSNVMQMNPSALVRFRQLKLHLTMLDNELLAYSTWVHLS
jgi:hypothetical protein